jgi:hypothetical protein
MAELALATGGRRRDGEPPDGVAEMAFRPSDSELSHFTVIGIETAGDRMTIIEQDATLSVPLAEGWADDGSIATSAARLDDGRIVVDLSFLHTPHRLEVELDPATATFVARWPLMPLFGVGPDHRLGALRSLPD